MIGFLWSLEAIFFNEVYRATKENDIEIASNLIVDAIGSENIGNTVEQIIDEYDLCMQVYNCKDASIIYTPECKSNGCIIHGVTDNTLYFHWLNGANDSNEGKFSEISSSENGEDFLVFARVVTDTKGVVYLLVLNASIEPMQSTISAIRTLLILISILFLIVAVVISFILAKRLSSPIVKMNNNAKKLARANYDVEFDIEGPIETRELAKTLTIATKELGRLDSMQKELIANISHDLRTPLTMISGYAEVMRDIPDENTPENVQVIIDETERLTELVNDMLDLSKIKAGTRKPELEVFNLTETVRTVMKRYEKLTEKDGYEISFEADIDVCINADTTMILQVIYNLINNALNYTGEDKKVRIVQTVTYDTVRISVIDTGEGIAADQIPYIWDRYYKVDKVHKRARVGTGLGLSIVKGILEAHGADYGVESKVGQGSTFYFELNVASFCAESEE